MIITKKFIPRRTFLRGVGATMALPLLEAMVPAATPLAKTAAHPVRRLGFVFMPMGCVCRWQPIHRCGRIGGRIAPSPGTFCNCVDREALTFALGRGIESYDAPAVRKIVREAQAKDFRFSSVILGIVNSTPFTMRRSVSP